STTQDIIQDLHKVLNDGPWFIKGHCLALQPLNPNIHITEMDFTYTKFWAQAHGLPFGKLAKSFAIETAPKVGTLIDVDCDVDGLQLDRSFLRFKVSIQSPKSLISANPKEVTKKYIDSKNRRKRSIDVGTLSDDNLVDVPIDIISIVNPSHLTAGDVAAPNQPQDLCYFYVDPIGRSGGLALWWQNNLSFDVVNGDKNLIIVNGSCVVPSTSWRACFIYGPHIREDRVALWNRISSLVKLSMCPFIVIGDFIIIRSARDKQGGSIYTSRSVDEFQAFLSASELFEIPYKELSYTWDNKRDVGANIHE
ncbi:reverse transcriptase, partial [Tanacetum coccineum]